ncbi:tetratricopeptide repeat protein [Thalassoglobus polymorphus]|uniref:Tetratricopeptide repeat protein n=1 Tax=Thalassoglobus polymorphus TaxID=2527994 RepID=A0A517QL35_9PLAN|nr:hypothetical protein [Thalassoglobus polymorphus]QDT32360.1 hypothetical protein Mal48_16050 [Thalassoglobus polymorphus]
MKVWTDFTSCNEAVSLAWQAAERRDFSLANKQFQDLLQSDSSVYLMLEYAQFLFDCVSQKNATDFLLESADTFLGSLDFRNCCLIYNRLAAFYRESENAHLARQYQQLAISNNLKSVTEQDCFHIDQTTLFGRAHDHFLDGELNEAITLLFSLREGNDFIAAKANLLLAELYWQIDDVEAGLFVLEEAIGWATVNEDSVLSLAAYELKSKLSAQNEDDHSAKESLDAALRIARSSGRCRRQLKRLEQKQKRLNSQITLRAFQAEWN